MFPQPRQDPFENRDLLDSLEIGLKFTGLDHVFYLMVEVDDITGQRGQQKGERQYDDHEYQQSHDEGGEDLSFS